MPDQKFLPIIVEDSHHVALFGALTEMTRAFVALAEAHSPSLKVQVNDLLAEAWVLRLEFTVGVPGALGCNVVLVSPEGKVEPFLSLDSPPTTVPFTC